MQHGWLCIFSLTIFAFNRAKKKNYKKESYLDIWVWKALDVPFQCNILMQAIVFVVCKFTAQRSINGVMNEQGRKIGRIKRID